MKDKKILNNLFKVKDIIIFILISILFLLPVLKELWPFYNFMLAEAYVILILVGVCGIVFLGAKLCINFEKVEDKKQYFFKILPIFIFLLYMIWTLISSVLSDNKNLAFFGTDYRKDGYISYIAYAGCFGLAFCMSSKNFKKALLYMFAIIAILTIIIAGIASHGRLLNLICCFDIKTASFYSFNHYGYYLMIATAISAFLFITEENKILKVINALMYTFLLYYLVLNDTFGCYLALILTFIIYFIITIVKKGKKLPISICIAILVLISVFANTGNKNIAKNNIQTLSKDVTNIVTTPSTDKKFNSAGTGRMLLWRYGIKFFMERPIFGYGQENLEAKYLENQISQDRPHNLLIQLATTSGLPGLLLYISAICVILWRSLKKLDMNNQLHITFMFVVISYLISAMFGNSMYYTSPYFFILLGFLMRENMNK